MGTNGTKPRKHIDLPNTPCKNLRTKNTSIIRNFVVYLPKRGLLAKKHRYRIVVVVAIGLDAELLPTVGEFLVKIGEMPCNIPLPVPNHRGLNPAEIFAVGGVGKP